MLAFALLAGLTAPGGGTAARAATPTPAVSAPAQGALAAPIATGWTLDELFVALREVETGGCPDGGRRARGDGGQAIGPYQIHRAYWKDARVSGRYEDCLDPDYARFVIMAYWRRYCPDALWDVDAQTLARVHNGGPQGHKRDGTLAFWRKVERELWQQRHGNSA